MRLGIDQILHATAGSYLVEPLDHSLIVEGLTWDSREITPGCVYVALPGEHVDGHDFVAAAFNAGAGAALVMHDVDQQAHELAQQKGAAIISVANTSAAVTDLARFWRMQLKGTVIGLTGSSGKTTTKNLVRDVLASQFSVVATKGNQNNELGVPRTLLNAAEDTQFVVVEMGMRGLNQISTLCEFAHPVMGIVVNVGESHIELLGSRENIARAKSEIFQGLPNNKGIAFVNAMDDFAAFSVEHAQLAQRGIEVVGFGIEPADQSLVFQRSVFARNVQLDAEGAARFTLVAQGFAEQGGEEPQTIPVALQLRGSHNASNATVAAAVGLCCGMTLEQVARALETCQPESGRQQVLTAPAGYCVIDDAYNANPESMKASLTMFSAMDIAGRRIAVLGDMGELGSYAPACHKEVGEFIATLPLDSLICIGELSAHIAAAAQSAGMTKDKITHVQTVEEALQILEGTLGAQDAVLVKASHFMGLSRVVEGLIK